MPPPSLPSPVPTWSFPAAAGLAAFREPPPKADLNAGYPDAFIRKAEGNEGADVATIIHAARAAGLTWERTNVCTFRNNLNKIALTAVSAAVSDGDGGASRARLRTGRAAAGSRARGCGAPPAARARRGSGTARAAWQWHGHVHAPMYAPASAPRAPRPRRGAGAGARPAPPAALDAVPRPALPRPPGRTPSTTGQSTPYCAPARCSLK
jgi:hypothetical protein